MVIDTALHRNEIEILSYEECPDLEYGKYIIQYQIGTEVAFMFSRRNSLGENFENAKKDIAEHFLEDAPLPLWSDLSRKLLDEIVESSFDMRFIEKDDEDWTQATANAILYEADNMNLSDVVTEGEDCYITIYAAAMCCVNWAGHSVFGVPYLTCKKPFAEEQYLRLAKDMQEEGIDPEDIRDAIALIRKLREEKQ